MKRYRTILLVEGRKTTDGRKIKRGATHWDRTVDLPVVLGTRRIGRLALVTRRGNRIITEIETEVFLDPHLIRACADFSETIVEWKDNGSLGTFVYGRLQGVHLGQRPCAHPRWGILRRVA
jgi:hypothetical protein